MLEVLEEVAGEAGGVVAEGDHRIGRAVVVGPSHHPGHDTEHHHDRRQPGEDGRRIDQRRPPTGREHWARRSARSGLSHSAPPSAAQMSNVAKRCIGQCWLVINRPTRQLSESSERTRRAANVRFMAACLQEPKEVLRHTLSAAWIERDEAAGRGRAPPKSPMTAG